MLETFFNPSSTAVIGVSSDPAKLGTVIFKNLIDAGYKGKLYAINPKLAGQQLYSKECYTSVREIKEPIDLVIIVIPAKATMSAIDDCIYNGVKNISIITAGFGEIGNHELEDNIAKKCNDNGINLLGPNCLGHISTFNNLNASFADGFPDKGNVAFISQSGAYCSAMLDWARGKGIGFSHFISIGNKAQLSETELLEVLKDDENTKAFVLYLESIKNGQKFLKIAKEITKTKPIVVLEPGKSSKAQAASLSHTGSLAPNYRVLEVAFEKSGIIQAHTTRELFGLLEILQYCKHNEFDGNLGLLTNAGGVGVLTSDLCEENGLEIPKPSEETINKLKSVLSEEAAFGNPIDVIGDAKADRYENALRILCQSGEYKNILILLTPQMVTDAKGTAEAIVRVSKEFDDINIFTSFIGGSRVCSGVKILNENHIINFDYPTDATRLLGLLKKQMIYKNKNYIEEVKPNISEEIVKSIKDSIDKNLVSLPQNIVNMIMDHYGLDYPKSGNFINRDEAISFCKKLFPSPVVLKLSAPDAIHKTEMKGVYLNINNEDDFDNSWKVLEESINKFNLKNASILIQEMITDSMEVIIGINSDKNFGKVMVFGSGGIYTEIMKDTTIRVLPTDEFNQMIDETKIGVILKGVRGEKPRAIDKLSDTLSKIQQIVFDLPQIVSIDMNPVLITSDRAVVVDFKIMIK